MTVFTKIYRFAWLVLIMLLIFLDRQNVVMVVVTLFLILLLAAIAILRVVESRNQWRKYILEEGLDEEIT